MPPQTSTSVLLQGLLRALPRNMNNYCVALVPYVSDKCHGPRVVNTDTTSYCIVWEFGRAEELWTVAEKGEETMSR